MPWSDEEYIQHMRDHDLQSIIYCKNLIKDLPEDESRWFDCTLKHKPCQYRKMSECNDAKPDNEAQEKHIHEVLDAHHFWEEYRKTDSARAHIRDFTIEELKQKHANVLKLIPAQDRISIGLLIAGKYYDNVWNSRSCSAHLSELIGGKDYLDFYCSSRNYYFLIKSGQPIVDLFKEADKKDRN